MKLYHHPAFAAPIGDHVMPMRKFALVAEQVRKIPGLAIVPPPPVDESAIALRQ